jgi:hypothetical protein
VEVNPALAEWYYKRSMGKGAAEAPPSTAAVFDEGTEVDPDLAATAAQHDRIGQNL